MAFLFKFSIIFCALLFHSATYCVPVQNTADLRAPILFSLAEFCAGYLRQSQNKKLPCLICKGLDPTCFIKTTTTTTSSTTTSTTTPTTTTQSTTSPTTTTPSTTSSTTTVPNEK